MVCFCCVLNILFVCLVYSIVVRYLIVEAGTQFQTHVTQKVTYANKEKKKRK